MDVQPPDPTSPAAVYRQRMERHVDERAAAAARSRTLGTARVLVFLGIVAAALWTEQAPGPLPLALLLLSIVVFIALVVMHTRVRRAERWAADLLAVQAEGLARLERAWDRLPPRPVPAGLDGHHLAADLDLFGTRALAQLLGPTATAAGRATLAEWLLGCAAPAEVSARQEAVRELADAIGFRDEVAVRARRAIPMRPGELDAFLAWAEEAPWLSARPGLVWSARLIPFATLLFATLDLMGVLGVSLWIATIGAAGFLTLGPIGRRVHATFDHAFGREGIFQELPELFAAAAALEPRSTRARALQARIQAGSGAAIALGRLRQFMHSADARHATGLLYLPLLLLTLWPFHVLVRMEHWQRANGRHARDWIEALAELEALAALAALAHDHPEWSFPELADDADRLEAEQLGHPMLPDDARVHNDVTVGPPGTFLLVTGSNMSGKSTLLRALGANVVLACAGGPVCAARLRMPPAELRTSVHVEDSLTEGVSYFMAQLRRVRDIVAAADAAALDHAKPRVLYLLDEILAGTNSAERRIAATRVIAHLVRSGAIGVVTTHDLELADEPVLAEAARPVHFSETILPDSEGAPMTFDYRLRPGVATSTNALKLMALVGLGAEREDGGSVSVDVT